MLTLFKYPSSVFFPVLLLIFAFTSCKSSEPVTDEQPSPTETVLEKPEPAHEPDAKKEEIYKESVYTDGVDVDSILEQMSLDEKIGQLFTVPAYGTFINDYDASYLRLKRLVRDYHIGGLIFFRGDIYGQATMTNHLQELSEVPLWISQDMEFGAAMRVSGTTRFTPAMGIAATGNPHNAYLKGQVTAREAKALGVHQIFAPVLDVNNNPQNPVINVRSYSADPNMVAEYAVQFMKGAQNEGVVATGKHFPGHGDTDTDSHLALPTIPHDYSRLESLELVPFRIAVNEGLKSVMSAHIAYPNISENVNLPGTLDESILNKILVDSLGFEGLVVTDGLEMQGITDNFSPGEAVIMSLMAGADMMLISPDELTAMNELKYAVTSGRISEERIDHSVRKILTLKKEDGLFEKSSVDVDALSYLIHSPEYQTTANRIARESVTILKDSKNILPLRENSHPNILLVSVSDGRTGTAGSSLARELRNYHGNITFHALDNRSGSEEIDSIIRAADRADLIIIGSFIMVRSHHPIQMPEKQLEVLKRLTAKNKPSVLMAFGNPYVVQDLPETDVHLLAWASDANQVQQSVPALFAASAVQGTLPINIPGLYTIGDGLRFEQSAARIDTPESAGMRTDSLLNIDMVMQQAINDSVFPGGVVAVMRKGTLVWQQGYGYHDYTKTRAVGANHIYDLASISKVMATTTSVMKLVDEGKLNLDDPVSKFFPEFDTDTKRDITIEHLLLHTSGLPAFNIYVDELKTRAEIVNAVKNEPLEAAPGEQYVYSDLGFILLGEIIHDVSGQRLDRFIRSRFFTPMGLTSSYYNPKNVGRWISNRIPPTEIDQTYGRGTVQAEAHDERAWFMDGIAGHAGLFSSAKDIAQYSYMLLNGGTFQGVQYLKPETIDLFTSRQSPINHRGYGFDRKSEGFSTAGTLTGKHTFGHTGFTGTSFWVDPDEEIAIILLTNRAYPHRSYGGDISRIRAKIADTVMKSIEH